MSSSNHCGVSVISRFSGGVSVVANGPTVNADVSIKIILKKAMSDKNNIKKCHVSNLIFEKSHIR